MNSKIQHRIFIFFLFALILSACKRDNDPPKPEPDYLVEYEQIMVMSTDDILNRLTEIGDLPPQISLFINHGVVVYRVVYGTTDTDNNQILASGALIVPDTESSVPLMSFQHGTITRDEDAPSWFTSDQYLAAVFYASTGYTVSLPDYIGYGISSNMDHPYEHGHSLATASRDMLRAVYELETIEKIFSTNNKLFLTGYSQGGYATMALLKLIEEQHSAEFDITAATAGAGAYDKSRFARHILELNEEAVHLNTFLWVLETYDRVYGINRTPDKYFNEPYASIIEEEGVFSNPQLNPVKLFNAVFSEGILNGSDTEFLNALADNDNYDWKPSTPLKLYHGTEDNFVYYFNSLSAYEAMKGNGAGSVELVTIEGGDHFTSVSEYITGTFLYFSSF